jgi:hypothetical protein
MRKAPAVSALLLVGASIAACSGAARNADAPAGTPDAATVDDAGPGTDAAVAVDAPADVTADVNKAAACASTFGTELVSGYGRLDGTVLAVVPPADNACALPNSDHVILEVTMHGAAYRMVVNVHSDLAGDQRVQMKEVQAPLLGGDWSEGWHVPAALDYPSALKVHDRDFTPYEQAPLVQRMTDFLTVGEKISVFATNNNSSYTDSAHLVHYVGGNQDGAIVVGAATASPTWLLFHFSSQVF